MVEANRYKLGFFIVVALGLIVAAFFSIGLAEIFKPRLKLVTVFKTSVEGLNVGSTLKYKGVAVGRVDRIAVRHEDGMIDVYMSVFAASMDAIDKDSKEIEEVDDNETLVSYMNTLRERGVSCSLQQSGIMGGTFIELEVFNPPTAKDKTLFVVKDLPKGYIYIPSRVTHITDIIENISKTLEQLSKINLKSLEQDIKETLAKCNRKLDEFDLKKLMTNLNRVSDQANETLTNINQTVDKQKIHALLKDFTTSLEEFRKVAKAAETNLNKVNGVRSRLLTTLAKINNAMDTLSTLANDIDENPASIIRGVNKPEIIKPKD